MTNPRYTMVIQWSEEDQAYLVYFPAFPEQQFITHGRTYQEAAQNGQDALEGLLEVFQDHNQTILKPLQSKILKTA